MEHLDKERIGALGRNHGEPLNSEEECHLADCAQCQLDLEQEKKLALFFSAIPQAATPDHFLAKTQQRFLAAQRPKQQMASASAGSALRLLIIIIPGLLLFFLSLLVLLLIAGIDLHAIPNFLALLVRGLSQIVIFFRAINIVFTHLPFLSLLLAGATTAAVIGSAYLTARLFRATRQIA
jgi:hypothetical protein